MSGILQTLFLGAAAAVKDAYFNLVTLLLNTTSTNGAQNNTFLDSSSNNFTITRNGNTTQGTFSPFSQTGWSNNFTGTAYLQLATGLSGLAVGANDFTVECFIYPTATFTAPIIFAGQSDGSTAAGSSYNLYLGTTQSRIYVGSTTYGVNSATPIINQWNHVAWVRSGSSWSTYLNGVQVATTTVSGSVNTGSTTNPPQINPNSLACYISNFRVVNGTALYTGTTYTVPTNPLTTISNTSLLACQSNRFLDSSNNGYTITPVNAPSVQAFSPFAPTTAYSTSTVGGSGYFDGSGDYLATTTTAIASGSTAFQIEGWVYPTAISGAATIFGGVTNGIELQYNTTNISINKAGVSNILIPSTPPTINAWNHILACRNTSGVISIYLNGVRRATATGDTNTFSATTANIGGTSYVTGYLAGVRYINGSNIVDPTQTSFTVPSAPVTAVTNTVNLLNFTNAGIYDSAAKNDLETVGNAQVSTTQAKFGTTSMYFDGSASYLKSADPTKAGIFGTGQFTVEGWIYPTSLSQGGSYGTIVATLFPSAGWQFVLVDGTGVLRWDTFGVTVNSSSNAISANVWQHIAVTRDSSNVLRIFVNGTQVSTNTTVTENYSTSGWLGIGFSQNAGATDRYFRGYIDEIRITKGYARYTANFTPPTAAFPVQ